MRHSIFIAAIFLAMMVIMIQAAPRKRSLKGDIRHFNKNMSKKAPDLIEKFVDSKTGNGGNSNDNDNDSKHKKKNKKKH
ncbi:hypothetical protein BDF14DRAFT_1785906 [Spinellus fusiger]|nr:hypothetical protein BDF14DRAFT_1785906 [Spinellus fusiger]